MEIVVSKMTDQYLKDSLPSRPSQGKQSTGFGTIAFTFFRSFSYLTTSQLQLVEVHYHLDDEIQSHLHRNS